MPKTLLAVDDSATMRKVLEITFSGEDYRIVTAESSQAAIAKLSEEPKVIVIDTALGSEDGYALSKEIRKRDGSATIVLLSSRHNPYDPAKGKDAGADDFMDKPFDTQQMVDKVRKIIQAKESGGAPVVAPVGGTVVGVAAPAVPPPAATPAPAPVAARPAAAAPAAAPVPAAAATPATAAAKPAAARAHTLMFGGGSGEAPKAAPAAAPPAAAPAKVAPAPAPVVARPVIAAASPQPPKVAPAPAAAAPAPAASTSVAGKVNGQLAGKLGDLGLTSQQIESVLALSREVVERVVWEVVPELAETLIKEEITRLMKA